MSVFASEPEVDLCMRDDLCDGSSRSDGVAERLLFATQFQRLWLTAIGSAEVEAESSADPPRRKEARPRAVRRYLEPPLPH